MKKCFNSILRTFTFIGAIIIFSIISSCTKDKDVQNQTQNQKDPKYVPFFEVAKGDSVSKDIFREKPVFTDSTTVIYSTANYRDPKASGNSSGSDYIRGLAIRISSSRITYPMIDIWNVIPVDLNEGAGGKYIYLLWHKNLQAEGRDYNNIHIHEGIIPGNAQPGESYTGEVHTGYPADLNDGAGGSYLYLVSYDYGALPVKNVAIVSSTNPNVTYNGDGGFWTKVPTDLNKGAGGRYIYLFYDNMVYWAK